MNRITIDANTCIGCKTCYKACFIDVIRWDDQNNIPISPYAKDCVGCMYCQANCPVGAITVEIDFEHARTWSTIPGDERHI